MGKLNMWLNGSTYGANVPLWKAWTLRKIVLLTAIMAGLLIIGGITYALLPHDPPRLKVTCVGDLPEDYDIMTERQINCRYEKDTGKDIRDLMDKKKFNDSTFKSFKEAEISARALFGMGKWNEEAYPKAVVAYSLADSKASGSDTNYRFYERYAEAALTAKEDGLYDEAIEKQKAAIKSDKNLSEARKADLLQTIEGNQKLLEMATDEKAGKDE